MFFPGHTEATTFVNKNCVTLDAALVTAAAYPFPCVFNPKITCFLGKFS